MGLFHMPTLGADTEGGTLVEWLKQPGDRIARGDIMAVLETGKGAIEIEALEPGIMEKALVEIGAQVSAGALLALIASDDAAEADTSALPADEGHLRVADADADLDAAPVAPPAVLHSGRPRVTPAARARALQSGVDLATVRPSGPDGAIVLADVVAALQRPPQKATGAAGFSGMRAALAAAMAHAKREIPHYYLAHTVDLTAAESFVAQFNADRPPEQRMLLAALFVKAVARSAAQHPAFNGHHENGVFTPSRSVHVGFAITIRGGGLVAPAIHDTASLDLDALAERLRDLATRVRAGRFRAAELSSPTITVSILGERGVEQLHSVIYPPQVAIVSFGSPSLRAIAVEDRIEARRAVTVTLAADHRVSDGHAGALFLGAISRVLQEPGTL